MPTEPSRNTWRVGLPCLTVVLWAACTQPVTIFDPDLLQENKIAPGMELHQVRARLGKPAQQLNFPRGKYRVSLWLYGSRQVDYRPGDEGNDTSILPHRYGLHEEFRRHWRLTFINGQLASIEDFLRHTYRTSHPATLSPEVQAILQEIHQME